MTQIAINEQIAIIKEATKKAVVSQKSARQFLVNAGIVKDTQSIPKKSSKRMRSK